MPLYRRPGSPFWWVRIGRKTRCSTGTTDKRKAKEFEDTLKDRLWRREKLGDRGAIPWNEAAQRWLNDSVKSRKRDREFINWLEPKIGQYPVASVADPDALEQLREDGLEAGWSHSTVDRMMRTVRAVLRKCAGAWRYLESPPIVPMYGAGDEVEPRWLTHEEFDRLKPELPSHLRIAAEFAIETMLRMRAQSRLTWDRIDLKARRAWIPGSTMKAGKTFSIPLSTKAIELLREAKRLNPTGDHVFQYEGRPIDNFNTAAFKKACKRADVAPLRWHDFRHTGASWAVQNGVTLLELMILGGWKSYKMVLRYAHFAPSHAAKAAELVSRREHTAEHDPARQNKKRAGNAGV